MVAAYNVETAADELIEALLEMSGLLAAQERAGLTHDDLPRFRGIAIPGMTDIDDIDELLTMTMHRVNTAVQTYRAVR